MARNKLLAVGTLLLAVGVTAAWGLGVLRRSGPPEEPPKAPEPIGRMVPIEGGTFRMGNDLSPHADQRPAHDVRVGPFRMDEHEVTNRQFAQFVEQTGYRTTAEQRGWSYVPARRGLEWGRCPGADWRHPGGPHTSIHGRHHYPVVHVSWHDAVAYAAWCGKRLPTEAQWEYAARSGLRDADYPWGREERIGGEYQANYRQPGLAPDADGHDGPAPVRSYPPSPFGLYDISGNVWEWCGDWYAEDFYAASPRRDPTGPEQGRCRVLRGGSWLSPESYSFTHHVSYRGKALPEQTYANVGFRCVRPLRSSRD